MTARGKAAKRGLVATVCRTTFAGGALLLLVLFSAASQYVRFVPQLHAGQTLIYQLEFDGSRSTRAESQVASPQLPSSADLKTACLLQVSVAAVTADGFRLKTYLSERAPAAPPANSVATQRDAAPDKLIEVSVASDGAASGIMGLDQLGAAQQFAWRAWLGSFTSSLTYHKSGVQVGESWVVPEAETTPAPLAKLVWLKKYRYVRDEPCTGSHGPAPADKRAPRSSDICAVILVQAQLRQLSSPKKATPEDFQLRGLVTRGTATGTNETILYLSRGAGLLVRSTEDAEQSMDATIALADGSNQVRYLIKAKTRSQIQLLSDSPQDAH